MRFLWAAASLLSWLAPSHSPDIQPVFDLRGRLCAPAPDLASAQPLEYAGRETGVDFQIVSASRCTQTGGGAVLYRVLRLPPAANPYVVTVSSQPFGNAILLPHLLLLDANGQVKREYARDDLMFRSNALSARFRSHPDETYLVVESDAGVTGTSISRIAESTNAYTAATGTAYFTIHTANDNTTQLIYSHTGQLGVMLEPLPNPR